MKNPRKFPARIGMASLVCLLCSLAAFAQQQATLTTDKTNYTPGDAVVVSGTGWQVGETVLLEFVETPTIHAAETLYAVANGSGEIYNNEYVIQDHDIGQTFTLTATGHASGLTAQTTFTDAGSTKIITLEVLSIAPATAPAGAPFVPILCFALKDTAAVDTLKRVKADFIPVTPGDIDSVFLYRENNSMSGFQTSDQRLKAVSGGGSGNPDFNNIVVPLVSGDTLRLYIVVQIKGSATPGDTIDYKITKDDITFKSGTWPPVADTATWNPAGFTIITKNPIVISEFRTHGPNGANDEFVELYNTSSTDSINIGAWLIRGSNNAASVSTRGTITAGKILRPGCHYLVTNSNTSGGPYSGSVTGDSTYATGITDDGGIGLVVGSTIIDQVGMSLGSAYGEGTRLAPLTASADTSYERKPGGTSGSGTDTDDNSSDFQKISPSDPQNSSTGCIGGACTPPTCTITGPSPVCAGSTNTYDGPASMTSYAWSVSGGTAAVSGSSTGSSVSINAGSAGTYTVSLTVTLSGCTSACTKAVTVTEVPACTITGPVPDITCFGAIVQHTGPPGVGYKWAVSGSGTLSSSSTGSSILVTAGASGSYTVSLTTNATSNTACTNSCTQTVTVIPQPDCTITGPDPVCFNSTNEYSGPAGVSYQWAVTGNGTLVSSSTGSSISVAAGTSGSYTIGLTTYAASLTLCTNSCTKTVTIEIPACTISGPDPMCALASNEYTASGNGEFAWSIAGDGSLGATSTGSSVTVTAGSSGSYTLTVTATVTSGNAICTSTCEKAVTILSPSCVIIGPSAVCASAEITYEAIGSGEFAWSIAGNATPSSGTGTSINVTAGSSGSYTLTVTATVTSGTVTCSSTCQKVVTILSPSCTISGPDPVCTLASNEYTASGNGEFAWSIVGNGSLGATTTGSSVTVTAGSSGSYTLTVTATVTSGNLVCTSTCTKTVTVNTNPQCTISGPDAVCAGSTNPYNGPASMSSYAWSVSSGGTISGSSTGSSVSIDAGSAGTYTVSLTVTESSCTSTCTKAVTVNANPACSIDGPASVCEGTTNGYNGPGGVDSYAWSVSGGSATVSGSSTGSSVSIDAGSAGTYTVSLTVTLSGCTSTCTKTVVVCGDLLTNSALCVFDVNPDSTGDQFRLIYTPDQASGAWKLNASNPGQFYYNVLVGGTPSAAGAVTITLPKPFVTQGANPVHVFDGFSFSNGCIMAGNEIPSSATPDSVKLATYVDGTTNVVVSFTFPATGMAYINIHLDYGWKHYLSACSPDSKTDLDVTCNSPSSVTINNFTDYTFSFSGPGSQSGSTTVENDNVVKNDPGIGGLVTCASSGDPIAKVKVEIYDASNRLKATVYTDADGWYQWVFKYTGKATTFVVKLPAYGLQQSVTLKSNQYVVVNFAVPSGCGSSFAAGGSTIAASEIIQVKREVIPTEFALDQNYPNPFNPTTQIQFDLPEDSRVKLIIYDILGREVVTLVDGEVEAGRYQKLWEGRNRYGQSVASGIYFYRMDAVSVTSDKKLFSLRKMLMLK